VGVCLRHDDIRHLRLYRDYMDIYQDNEHKSKIVRILETWTNTKYAVWYKQAKDNKEQKLPIPPFDGWVTMSYQQFSDFMYGTTKIDTIKKNLVELEKDKHVERRINPDNPYGSPQYRLNLPLIQKLLDERNANNSNLSEFDNPLDFSYPLGFFTPAGGVNVTPTQGVNLPVPQGGKVQTSNNSNKQSSKNTKRESKGKENQQPSPFGTDVPPTLSPSFPSEDQGGVEPQPEETEPTRPASTPTATTPKQEAPTNGSKGAKQGVSSQSAKPEMPTNASGIIWNEELFIQTMEARKGRRYPNGAKHKADRVRDVEMDAARTLMTDAADIWDGRTIEECRFVLCEIAKFWETDWWLKQNGQILPHQLLDKDRIHTGYDAQVKAGKIPAPGASISTPPSEDKVVRLRAYLAGKQTEKPDFVDLPKLEVMKLEGKSRELYMAMRKERRQQQNTLVAVQA